MNKTKILIVEDEAEIADSIRSVLEERGYLVVNIVSTGEDAIETVKSSEVNLVLMDIVLSSEMSGTEAAEFIKTHYNIPIIFLTAYFNEYMLEQAKESLPFGYILKPFNERELYATIEMALYRDSTEKKKEKIARLLNISNNINKLINRSRDKSELISRICKIFSGQPGYCCSFIILIDKMNNITETVSEGLGERFDAILKDLNGVDYPGWFRKAMIHKGILQELGSPAGSGDKQKTVYLRLESEQKVHGVLAVIVDNRYLENEEIQILTGLMHEIAFALDKFDLETKNKSMEVALAESFKKYKQVIENAADLIFTIDLSGIMTFVNEAGLNSIGYTWDEILHINFFDLILPERKNEIQKFYKEQITTEKKTGYIEFPLKTKNEEIRWYGQNANLLLENNKITGFHCIARDITERKKIEKSLHESEVRYRQLVETSPDAIIVYSKGKVIFANDAGVKLFGAHKESDLIDKSITGLLYPHTIDISKSRHDDTGEVEFNALLQERQIRRLDDTLINVELTANKILYHNTEAYQVVIRDVSERKRVERELKRRQREVTTLLDSLPAYAFFKDINSKYVTANKKFCEAVGYSKEEILGKTDYDFFPKEVAEKYQSDDMKVLNSGEPIFIYEERMYEKNKQLTVGTNKVPLIDENGKIAGLIGLAFDISERKAAEEAVKLYTKELEELNTNKDKFFSIISHDLRSPFQGLLGLSNILVEEFDNLTMDEIKLFTSNIHNSTKNLFNLLENLLQWSRIQTGKIDLKPVVADLYEEVLYNISLLNGNASKKNIKLINEIRDTLPVYTDLNILNSTLQNLISNAIKFTQSGGEIKISCEEIEDNIQLTVSDTGIGIGEEDIEKLFRIDTQHTTLGTDRESGTGLGLTICKELLEKQGGRIWVKSEIGRGSAFTFTVKKHKEE